MLCQKFFDGRYSDLRRRFVGEMKYPGGDAAERDALQTVFRRKLQTRAVAGGEKLFIPLRDRAFHDGANRVQHVPAGKIEGGGDLRFPGGFGVPLLFHQLRAGEPQLHARVGVDDIVDASVIGDIAAGHAGVRGVDDGIAAERCDISLPEIEPRLHGNKIVHVRNALRCGLALQVFILHAQKLRPGAARPADVHQTAQKLPLVLGVGRNIFGIPAFCQQRPEKIEV